MTHAPTLTEALRRAGYTHRRMPNTDKTGRREVLDAQGRVVFEGRARHVWAWMRRDQPATQPTLFGEELGS